MFEFFEAVNMERDDPTIPGQYALACAKAQEVLYAKAINAT